MLSDAMLAALLKQTTAEFYSGYLYLQMSAWFEAQFLPGFANWMRVQAQEETSHAMIFFNYIDERDGDIELGAIDKPPHEYSSPLDVLEKTLEHERKVTASINDLVDQAISEKDHATKNKLDWFVAEQVEEEATAIEIIGRLKLAGGDAQSLLLLDQEMATRTFTLPAPLAGGEE